MPKDNWTSWCRSSHFRLGHASVTIHKDGISLNASLNKIVDVAKYQNVRIDLNHPDPDLATKIKCELNNDEEDKNNFKIIRPRHIEDKRRGFIACRNLIDSQPKLKKIGQKLRSARRIEVKEYGKDKSSFTFDLQPVCELSVANAADLPAKGGIYRYVDKSEIVYYGRAKNIKLRARDSIRDNWVYDKIEYSLIDSESEQVFWESKFLDDFKASNNRLPRYNQLSGTSIIKLESRRSDESVI